ncbi:MAG: methylenetetrahydrofolate--tRNA-(uracil(54)-C(5))-methyltransferase (FADH(2)-oxidizing) TrmFO [Kiritimatiellae bacterium]|nr:methylenetetrahydrofolate--tRNA-(uracil(54)-C(5))-methyltransferase (FADH(2)-oxidizing) TrmFO [Kiritimatiellia bacterium]
MSHKSSLLVAGGGLAGTEAAWQAAERGLRVTLIEMRPGKTTGAHRTDQLAELVCSNSLGSALPDRATGLLHHELRRMGSLLISCADECRVPAGGALAVGREAFAQRVTERLAAHPNITLQREEITSIPEGPCILATGPLTSDAFAETLARFTGAEQLFFFDALAPVVERDSVNLNTAFRASRYERGENEAGDYLNCPMNRTEYDTFITALLRAERIVLKSFEQAIESGVRAARKHFFEGCLPIEIMAARGHDALAFGPLRPVGLTDPRTGRRPHAVLQLRQDDLAGSLCNLVGFQTNLKFAEQERVFRLIPGLEQAVFARYGQMHRNTYICAPAVLHPTLQSRLRDDLFFAGQLAGIEGYAGNIASGLLAGINATRQSFDTPLLELPRTTMLGALMHYLAHAPADHFQPAKANFGLLPDLPGTERLGKRARAAACAERARTDLEAALEASPALALHPAG